MDERERQRYRSKRMQEQRMQERRIREQNRQDQHIRKVSTSGTLGREERMRRRRRRRRQKKLLRAMVLAILAAIVIGIFLLVFWLGRLINNAVEKGEVALPWDESEDVIMLDAGHGGEDPGASYDNVLEKDLTIEITQKTKELLKEAGYRVRMTRTEDSTIDKYDRAAYANKKEPDIFVSIHCNFLEEGEANGIETFYAEAKSEDSKDLAQCIQTGLIEETGARDRGAKTADYVVVKDTKMPAALVEVGFLSDAQERKLLQQEDYQQKLAEGIVAGIQEYLAAQPSAKIHRVR